MVKSTALNLGKEVDTEFRECISLAYPEKHGNRKKAGQTAILNWCIARRKKTGDEAGVQKIRDLAKKLDLELNER